MDRVSRPHRPVVWAEAAVRDLEAIRAYIETMNPSAAARVAQSVAMAADTLGTFPMRGRNAGGSRQFVAVAPYVIRYRVEAAQIVILRVRHGRRRRT